MQTCTICCSMFQTNEDGNLVYIPPFVSAPGNMGEPGGSLQCTSEVRPPPLSRPSHTALGGGGEGRPARPRARCLCCTILGITLVVAALLALLLVLPPPATEEPDDAGPWAALPPGPSWPWRPGGGLPCEGARAASNVFKPSPPHPRGAQEARNQTFWGVGLWKILLPELAKVRRERRKKMNKAHKLNSKNWKLSLAGATVCSEI